MSAATVRPGAAAVCRPRVYGAVPFRTDGDLLGLAFAADGTLWSVEDPGLLRHWDVAGRRQIAYTALDEPATLWSFSPGARLVAAGSDDVSVWEVAAGRLRACWAQPSWVTAIVFPPELSGPGEWLAIGHDDAAVRLWDLATERVVREFRGPGQAISALAFSPDGTRLAAADEGKVIHIWDLFTGNLLVCLEGHTDRIPALVWSPDGRRLISAGWDTTARVWDAASGEPIILLNSHAAQVHALALSPDGTRLACADSASAIHVWDAQRHRTLRVLRGQVGEVRCLAFSPDGRRLASGGVERAVRLWEAGSAGPGGDSGDALLSRAAVAVSPDGSRLACLAAGTPLRVWDTHSGHGVLELEGNPILWSFAASPDGRWLAGSVASEAGQAVPEDARDSLRLWHAESGKPAARLDGQAGPIITLTFSPDSRFLASAGLRSGDVWLWQLPQGEPALLIPEAADDCAVEALAFHPASRLLAVGGIDHLAANGFDGAVAVWDIQERKKVAWVRGAVTALAFSPDGSRLAAASLRRTLLLWQTGDWRRCAEPVGHLDLVSCLAFSPDGRLLASGSDDRTVRLWDAVTGVLRGSFELDTQVKALAFAPDGKSLFTGNGNTSCYQLRL
jgi:WD40 repeat protein